MKPLQWAIIGSTTLILIGGFQNCSKPFEAINHAPTASADISSLSPAPVTLPPPAPNPIQPKTCTPAGTVERSPVRRLTHVEYQNSIRDIFGLTDNYISSFSPDPITKGFTNNAYALTIDSVLTDNYLLAAEKVVSDLLTNRSAFVFTCTSGESCAQAIFTRLASLMFRRPIAGSDDQIQSLMQFVFKPSQQRGESFSQSVSLGLQALLLSPEFLYQIFFINDPDNSSVTKKLSEYELASRLSYFLWSSAPDQKLRDLASQGILSQQLDQEVLRMLGDPKSKAWVDQFAVQWMKLGKLKGSNPDTATFPLFNDRVRQLMETETMVFLTNILRRDRSLVDIFEAKYTYLNQELAQYYGIPGVSGTQFQEVSLSGTERMGVLTHGSILTMNSSAQRSDVIKRGFWVLENILCSEPPPPPDNVPALPESSGQQTLREILEQHRASPTCFACHATMDPIGFGLEKFDGVGRWQAQTVDDTGILPGGRSFRGVPELVNLLRQEQQFQFCASQQLMTYAFARAPKADESCRAQQIGRDTVQSDSSLSDTILRIVKDPSFLYQRGGSQ